MNDLKIDRVMNIKSDFYAQFLYPLLLIILWFIFYFSNLDVAPISSGENIRISIAYSIHDLSGLIKATYLDAVYYAKTPVYSFLLAFFRFKGIGGLHFLGPRPHQGLYAYG